MNSMLFYTTSLSPPVGDPTAMYAPLLRYKREALAMHWGLSRDTQALANSLSREDNTTRSGRRVLRSGSPNHSNPAVFIVFLREIELGLANPRVHTLWARASAFRHPAVVCSTTTFIILDVLHLCCLFYFKIRGPFTKRTTEPNLLFKIFLLVICDYRIT